MTPNVQVALFIMSDFDRTEELLKNCLFRTSHAGQRSHDSQPASRTASRTILRYRRPQSLSEQGVTVSHTSSSPDTFVCSAV